MAPRQLLISSSSTATPPYPHPPIVAQPPNDVVTTVEPNILVTVAAVLFVIISTVAIFAIAHCLTSSSSSSPTSKGLNRKTLNSFPKLVYRSTTASSSAEDCSICLAEFANGERIRLLPKCGHRFHVHCVDTWLAKHSSCPYCRLVYTQNSSDN